MSLNLFLAQLPVHHIDVQRPVQVVQLVADRPGLKALVGRETDAFFGALTELAAEKREGAEIWFEVNPTSMM